MSQKCQTPFIFVIIQWKISTSFNFVDNMPTLFVHCCYTTLVNAKSNFQQYLIVIMPPPLWSHTSGLSRTERPSKTKIGTEVANITRDSDHFQRQKVKGQLAGGGGILWRPLIACFNCDDTSLMAIFQDNLGKPVPECLYSGFYWTKDDGGGAYNCNYKKCKTTSHIITTNKPTPKFLVAQLVVSRHLNGNN